jgi:competence protein ComEC
VPLLAPLPWSRWPLLPVAIAVSAGCIIDRGAAPALAIWAALACIILLVRLLQRPLAGSTLSQTAWLWLLAGALAGAWHHLATQPTRDDVCRFADEQGRFVRLRGVIHGDVVLHVPAHPALLSMPDEQRVNFRLKAAALDDNGRWLPVGGTLRVGVGEAWLRGKPGQTLELLGQLYPAPSARNPGEANPRRYWQDQGIFALLQVKNAGGIQVIAEPSFWSLSAWLAALRHALHQVIADHVNPANQNVALALLLGEQQELTAEEFAGYQRTGVFHVLAISGHHLVVLTLGLGFLLWLCGLTPRQCVPWLLAFVLAYALLTGARPPVLRAAIMVGAFGLGALLGRSVQPINSLALAWLVIFALNPTDLFQPGVQLSFLAVLVLFVLVTPLWEQLTIPPLDPLTRLAREYEPHWKKLGRWGVRWLVLAPYLGGLIVWLAAAPLIASRFHLFSPIALLVGPPIVLLASGALMAGLILIIVAPLSAMLASFMGMLVNGLLGSANGLVAWALALPGGHLYVPDLPEAWLIVGYAVIFLLLFQPWLWRHWRFIALAGVAWLMAAVIAARPTAPAGLRLTVLAVGHGSCAVAELDDGRVLLFDAGSLIGPEVAEWSIAPFLWSRGHTRIDEVFLSHADLDHFNGLPILLERFRVAQISCNPSFTDKPAPAVRLALARLARHGVPLRKLSVGMQLTSGQTTIEVLHPPAVGPGGAENARSLVLLLRCGQRTALLTGDLEPPGLRQVLARARPAVDVLVAPHHGSPISNTDDFARWADAGLVISSEGQPRGRRPDPYSPLGATLWRTRDAGAVCVEIDSTSLAAQTYVTKEIWRARPR